jgi:FAD/FMN-containing dehydrogenase
MSDGGLVIDLSPLRRVEVDGDRVRVGGGATLGDVDAATLPRGRAVPLGVVPPTGVAGLALHGGYGWLSRRFGLTADSLVAATVVTADGGVRRASAGEDPDLLWALRGGGGNFGVVASFEFASHPIPPAVTLALSFFPLDEAETALRRFRGAMGAAPEALGSVAFLWSTPPFPEVPPARHGEAALAIVAVWSGAPGDAAAALAPLREAGRSFAGFAREVPFAAAQRLFADEFPDGRLYYWKSHYLPALDDDTIAALVEATPRRPSPRSFLDCWALGGAIARVPDDATAFAHRQAPVLVGLESCWDEPERTADNIAFTRAIHAQLAKGSAGTPYLNFPGFGEGGEGFVRAAYGPNYDRLRELKARYDPDNLFRGNFNLPPAEAGLQPAPTA